ncbi:hypothetical protein JDV02_004780 [Purpureocillium takamizusanense]|uniref:SCP domain-containing protein n=1 Tax=Purpureocillium takamizusanense TaxID=2060973 RepID=A0A9Q8VB44_9HYPO|nr:uncharacterized protein JDV02_004780 [Purpureocillium takamizusanense]UNI18516.1 hypothetical protein JDV02_004780 [Purpureocillium takamizusanense]
MTMKLSSIVATSLLAECALAQSANDSRWTNEAVFQDSILNTTNGYREEHGAHDVHWNATLASFAKSYLDRSSCKFAHSHGPYGENLAAGYVAPASAIRAFGEERKSYNFSNPNWQPRGGHFTQLVWKKTNAIGCAAKHCGKRMRWYLVCEYSPRGNVIGAFKSNVGRKIR